MYNLQYFEMMAHELHADKKESNWNANIASCFLTESISLSVLGITLCLSSTSKVSHFFLPKMLLDFCLTASFMLKVLQITFFLSEQTRLENEKCVFWLLVICALLQKFDFFSLKLTNSWCRHLYIVCLFLRSSKSSNCFIYFVFDNKHNFLPLKVRKVLFGTKIIRHCHR